MNSHPFARILLATEHTDFDVGAERLALEMAHRWGLPLAAVLPVLSNPEFEAEAPQLAERAEREAAAKISALQSQARKVGVTLDIGARHGEDPYREIVDEATRRSSDLIVIRIRGKRSFLANLLIGEMVSKVVGHAPCSTLMVPPASNMWSRSIVAAVDESSLAERVVTIAATIATICNLPLTIINVAHSPEMQKKAETIVSRNIAVATAIGTQAQGRVLSGKPHEQILAASKSLGADLIVIGKHGDGGLAKMYLGSTMQKIAGLAEVPVLAVHL